MSYCNKHNYPENMCAGCVKDAVERNTFVLQEIHELLRISLIKKPTFWQTCKQMWEDMFR